MLSSLVHAKHCNQVLEGIFASYESHACKEVSCIRRALVFFMSNIIELGANTLPSQLLEANGLILSMAIHSRVQT
uniref:Uncharacterized protein n=1 Tax=Setaria italica TaxID=4555 RepID=K4AHK5_SETIT